MEGLRKWDYCVALPIDPWIRVGVKVSVTGRDRGDGSKLLGELDVLMMAV